MPNYYYWTSHGEVAPPTNQLFYAGETSGSGGMHGGQNTGAFAWNDDDHVIRYEAMVRDAGGVGCSRSSEQQSTEEIPNMDAARFYEMLNQAQEPLWDGCDTLTALSSAVQMMSLKSDHNLSQECFNDFCQFLDRALPRGHKNVEDYYR